MESGKRIKTILSKALVAVLSAAMLLTAIPPVEGYASGSSLSVQKPVLLVTGTGLIGRSGKYNKDNVSLEKSYTMDDFRDLGADALVSGAVYSAKKAQDPYTKNYFIADGVRVSALLGKSDDSRIEDDVTFISDDREVKFVYGKNYSNNGKLESTGLDEPRYLYDFSSDARAEADPVPAVLAWAEKDYSSSADLATVRAGKAESIDNLRLMVGQLEGDGAEDMNQQLYSKYVNSIVAGENISETILTVGSRKYTRADILQMDFAERTYTYDTQAGTRRDSVRGVPLTVLLGSQSDDASVVFESADGMTSRLSAKELIDGNFVLAYELEGAGIYDADSDSVYGLLRLYGDNFKPLKMIKSVTVEGAEDLGDSPYKHITNGGISGQDGPYNIDAITGATLTVEGPGLAKMSAMSVRELEAADKGCAKGKYTDTRNGKQTERYYEGIDLYYLLTQMGRQGINLTDRAYKVTIKNRNRKSIATLSIDQLKKMSEEGNPALIAYGTANADESDAVPFVYDGAAGLLDPPGNGDGCLKFVYDLKKYGDQNGTYKTFGNMAYIYVEEENTAGAKHSDNPTYNSAENTQYILTVTGDEIGREINYTVEQLESLVKKDEKTGEIADNGYGFSDEYSLANSTYWYVNEYEGVKLWSLLMHSGISPDRADDAETPVTFNVTDSYTGYDTFTLKETAHPELFGFYEKNAADNNDGKYKANENLREDDPDGDKLSVGYPVMVAYGVNDYPYVKTKKSKGYLSGLSNDGGPLRIISGKRDYHHANGSKQAKNVDKIIVGSSNYTYSTHSYQPESSPYKALEDKPLNVKVTIEDEVDFNKTYTVGEIEKLIYGSGLSKSKQYEVRNKDFYETADGGSMSSDLYEGIDLAYFLKDVIKLAGSKGTVTFTSGDSSSKPVTMKLETLLGISDGYNASTGVSGLTPMIAYAKNGYPLVSGTTAGEGWIERQELPAISEGESPASYPVRNQGGPLMLVIPRPDKESADKPVSLNNITGISIDLEPDKFAHIKDPYRAYSDKSITIGGKGTRLDENKTLTVRDIEGRQSLAVTGDYSLRDESGNVSQKRYRGLDLSELLKDAAGINNKADKVLVYSYDSDQPVELSWSEVRRTSYTNTVSGESGLHVILAYGSAEAGSEEGKALVTDTASNGYDSACGNDGGPLMLVIGQTDASDSNLSRCVRNVSKIEVTASDDVRWNHSSSEVFSPYLGQTVRFRIVDKEANEIESVDYSVEELEAMTELVVRDTVTATSTNEWEGLEFWPLIQTVFRGAAGVDSPIAINVTSSDESGVDVMEKLGGLEGLKNGVKDGDRNVPVMLAYAFDGNPLAIEGEDGFDPELDNKGGPLRLMIHNAQGACISDVATITVKVSGSSSDMAGDPVRFAEYEGKAQPDGGLPLSGIRATAKDKNGNLWIGTYGGGAVYRAKNSKKFRIYNKNSKPALKSAVVSSVCPDKNGGVYLTQNASYTEPEANRGVAYLKKGKVKYFRASSNKLPSDYVQEIKIDSKGQVWFGSDMGLTRYIPAKGKWKTWGKSAGFPASSIDNIEFDSKGGIWCGFYPGSESGDGSKPFVGGFAYFKDGKVVKSYQYESPKDAYTGQYRLGDVWIRDIAVDKKGGAWIIASGSYGGMKNTGGRVWYVSSPGAEAVSYTGFELFGKRAFSTDSELRMVTVDPDGGLWLGTSKDGVFYVADPVIKDGKLELTAEYSSATGSWSKSSFDNVYSLDFHGNTLYSGSSGGLTARTFTFNSTKKPGQPKITLKAGRKSVTVKWKKTSDAKGYEVFRSVKKTKGFKKVKTIKSAKTVKFVNKKLKGRKVYYYKVRAYRVYNGKKIYSKFSAVKKVKTKR